MNFIGEGISQGNQKSIIGKWSAKSSGKQKSEDGKLTNVGSFFENKVKPVNAIAGEIGAAAEVKDDSHPKDDRKPTAKKFFHTSYYCTAFDPRINLSRRQSRKIRLEMVITIIEMVKESIGLSLEVERPATSPEGEAERVASTSTELPSSTPSPPTFVGGASPTLGAAVAGIGGEIEGVGVLIGMEVEVWNGVEAFVGVGVGVFVGI